MTTTAEKIEIVLLLIISFIAIGMVIFMVVFMITYEPQTISYGGDGHVSNIYSDDGIIIYNSNNSTHLIIPIDVNTSTYISYTWNGSAWVVDNFIGNNQFSDNLTMQDLINKSDWSLNDGY